MKSVIPLVALVSLISTVLCKASGKIEKGPCCDTPSNDPSPKPKKK